MILPLYMVYDAAHLVYIFFPASETPGKDALCEFLRRLMKRLATYNGCDCAYVSQQRYLCRMFSSSQTACSERSVVCAIEAG